MESEESLTDKFTGWTIATVTPHYLKDYIEVRLEKDGRTKTMVITVKYSSPRIREKDERKED